MKSTDAPYDYAALKDALVPIDVLRARVASWRKRRERKPTLAAALKQASKAGQYVSGAVIEDGKIELKFVKPVSGNGAATDVELEEFEAQHG
jgi:hypothetical protein